MRTVQNWRGTIRMHLTNGGGLQMRDEYLTNHECDCEEIDYEYEEYREEIKDMETLWLSQRI